VSTPLRGRRRARQSFKCQGPLVRPSRLLKPSTDDHAEFSDSFPSLHASGIRRFTKMRPNRMQQLVARQRFANQSHVWFEGKLEEKCKYIASHSASGRRSHVLCSNVGVDETRWYPNASRVSVDRFVAPYLKQRELTRCRKCRKARKCAEKRVGTRWTHSWIGVRHSD